VTLILRPPGRGNWTPVVVTIAQSRHAPVPLEFHVGQRVEFGGQMLRVCAVLG
jgi:hypothetical protein